MSEKVNIAAPKLVAYIILFGLQIIGAVAYVWMELPAFRQVAFSPGQQLPYVAYDDLIKFGIVLLMQVAYWYRLQRVPIPFNNSRLILSHLLVFAGRLSFIFGGAIFSLVLFRHLPDLDGSADVVLLVRRGALLIWALFALFCVSLELDRLGRALESDDQN